MISKLYFKIDIDAPKEKVWKALWSDATYPEWTRVFSEGSKAISDWKEGSKITFLNKDGDGMHSIIEKKVENFQMIFRHIGMVIKGKEQGEDDEQSEWENARERYFLIEHNGVTELTVELDSIDEYKQYFNDTFPAALESLNEIVIKHPELIER